MTKRNIIIILFLLIIVIVAGFSLSSYKKTKTIKKNLSTTVDISHNEQKAGGELGASDVVSFSDDFSKDDTFVESGDMGKSAIPNWWLNSGGYFYVRDGVGKTIQGGLPQGDKWQIDYKNYNASETDDGYHPQNIFRLVTKSKWKNLRQECYYKINRYILSNAKERSASNGLLLFNRYQNGDNLYYTGIRVDGTVVIKKKIDGNYYTMNQSVYFPGKYDIKNNPNLLPLNKWVGVRSEVNDLPNGNVLINVFVDSDRSGNWKLALTATDDGVSFGGPVIASEGYAGMRTDFMDVEFDDYKIEELK